MKYFVLLFSLIILNVTSGYAQGGFNIEFGVGYAFQNETTPDKLDFYDTNTLGIRFGGTYQRELTDTFLLETGFIGKYNRGERETELVNFVSHNFRIQLPLYLGFKPMNRFIFKAGIGVENNRDLSSLDFSRKDHNLRLDFLTKINYLYSKKVSFSLYSNWSMSNAPDVYTINSPDNGVYLGITYQL